MVATIKVWNYCIFRNSDYKITGENTYGRYAHDAAWRWTEKISRLTPQAIEWIEAPLRPDCNGRFASLIGVSASNFRCFRTWAQVHSEKFIFWTGNIPLSHGWQTEGKSKCFEGFSGCNRVWAYNLLFSTCNLKIILTPLAHGTRFIVSFILSARNSDHHFELKVCWGSLIRCTLRSCN